MNADLVQRLEELGVDLEQLTLDDILTGAEAARRPPAAPETP